MAEVEPVVDPVTVKEEDDLIDVSVDDQEISSEEECFIEVVGGRYVCRINPEVKDDATFGVTGIDDAFTS